MATETIVQNKICNQTTTKVISGHHNHHHQQLSSISLMLEYDIDNTLNTIRENNGHLINLTTTHQQEQQQNQKMSSLLQNQKHQQLEINNNNNNNLSLEKSSSSSSELQKTSTNMMMIPSSTTTINDINNQTNARKRWKILAKVLRKDSVDEQSSISSEDESERTASVRRFKSFDLLQQNNFDESIAINFFGKQENWYTYKICLNHNDYAVNIHHIDRHLTAADLMGFNNTGNICVWPSEEALTVYVLSELHNFRGKWILELGGGMTCLTGLMLAKYAKPYVCHLTDGNNVSVENVRKTICLNELSCYTKCSVLKWENILGRNQTEYEKFDIILSADCLFFDDARQSLIDTIWYYLSINGIGLVMAPQRGKTMTRFINDCQLKGFNCEIIKRYNEIIWQRHLELKKSNLYDEDIHYPILLKLTKGQNQQK